eukprot:4425759-Pleurochrysis_carterae.AAC.1
MRQSCAAMLCRIASPAMRRRLMRGSLGGKLEMRWRYILATTTLFSEEEGLRLFAALRDPPSFCLAVRFLREPSSGGNDDHK